MADQPPQPTTTGHPTDQPPTTNISPCYPKKKKKNKQTELRQTPKSANRSTQTQTPISTQISQPPDQPTTINQSQATSNNQNNQPPKERERDRRDRSGNDDGDDRSGLAHAACAFDDDDDGDDLIKVVMIGVALPMLLAPTTAMTMAMI